MIRRTARAVAAVFLAAGLFALAASPGVVAGPKDVEAKKYTEQLQTSKDPKIRATAIEEIGKLAQINTKLGEAAVGDIKKALKDKDVGVRKAAALAYGQCDPDETDAVSSLIDVLKNDKDENVKLNAALGLVAMGSKAKVAIPVIQEARKAASNEKIQKKFKGAEKAIGGMKKKA